MPLPSDTPLSLQGYSRPGDTVQSKPKQAIIIRMSAPTLDALDALPQGAKLDVEFNDGAAGLRIGGKFFPIRGQPETMPHELYLRTAAPHKQNAPLKLHAAVTGKYQVERTLEAATEAKIRASATAAERARTERKVVMLDVLPSDTRPTKKSKQSQGASAFIKPNKTAIQAKSLSARPTPSGSGRASPMPPIPSPLAGPTLTSDERASLRRRMVHYLALEGSRTEEEIMKAMGGHPKHVLDMLAEVAEQLHKRPSDKVAPWQLKTKCWVDVRPYEWHGLSEERRTDLARQARIKLGALNIPASDPVWERMQFRKPGPPPPPSLPASLPPKPKEMPAPAPPERQKKAKTAAPRVKRERDRDTPVMMKDESLKRSSAAPSGRSTPVQAADGKARSTATDSMRSSTSTPVPGLASVPQRRLGPVDARASKQVSARTESPLGRERERPAPPNIAPPLLKSPAISSEKERERRKEPTKGRDREEKEKERARQREKSPAKRRDEGRRESRESATQELEEGEYRPPPPPAGTKRKKARHEEDEEEEYTDRDRERARKDANSNKRRRTAEEPAAHRDVAVVKREERRRESSPAGLSAPTRPIKKEPSPLPSMRDKRRESPVGTSMRDKRRESPADTSMRDKRRESPAGTSSTTGSTSKPAKSRRRSPIYTSSEEEEPAPPPKPKPKPAARQPESAPPPPRVKKEGVKREGVKKESVKKEKALPTDAAGLQALYNRKYTAYLAVFSKVVGQRALNERQLQRYESGTESEDGELGTDAEGDVEMLDAEQLFKLTEEHKRKRAELEEIKKAHAALTGLWLSDAASD